jgi:Zn-dependent metalloprotease
LSFHSVRARRRAQAVAGITATLGLLGAGPALSAADSSAKPPTAVHELSMAAVSGVPSNVSLLQVRHSLLGVHTWYQQMLNGYPVVGGLYAVHTDTRGPAKGAVSVWDGRVKAGPLASSKAAVSMTSALHAAAAYTNGKPLTFVKPTLWVLPGAQSHLVWKVTTLAKGGAHLSYVDAVTGSVRSSFLESQDARSSKKYVNGKAQVFDPNPVVKLQDENLTDQNDSNDAVPKKGYSMRVLGHLDTSHTLVGEWAKIVNSDIAHSKKNRYVYKRADDRFEQVMDYYALDTEESYYQSLGFDDVNAEPQKIQADAMADDNSWYIPSQDLIQTGTGGVDDAEDPEVVWHEDGHATQDDQVPGFGQSEQAGAIGEGFGDYMAVTMGQIFGKDTELTPTTCVMDWDSTSYTPPPKHCLRTTDTDKMYPGDLDGEVHDDGEIWSHALWNMNVALGRDQATTIIIEAQFNYSPSTTMPQAAQATVDAAKKLYGKKVAAKTKQAFQDRGIL